MSKETNERLKRDTQHVPLRQNAKGREGAKSGVGRHERIKHGRGTQDRDERSNGIEIRIADAFAIIKPTAPLRLAKHEARRKRNWSDSSGNSLAKADDSR